MPPSCRKSICYVHKDLADVDRGGVSVLFKTLASGLLERGWRVHTVSSQDFTLPGVVHHKVPLEADPWAYSNNLASLLIDLDVSIFECSSWRFELLEYAKYMSRGKVVVRCDPTAGTLFPGRENLERGEKDLCLSADRLIAVSGFAADDYRVKFGLEAMRVIHNGIASTHSQRCRSTGIATGGIISRHPRNGRLDPRPANGIDLASLIDSARSNVVWAGKATWMKGFDWLEGLVLESDPEKINWIVNLGQSKGDLLWSPEAMQRCTFVTELPRCDQLHLWSLCDVYLGTSRVEGFCLALAEALDLGLPCVVNKDCKVFSEFVRASNLFYIDVADPAATVMLLNSVSRGGIRSPAGNLPTTFTAENMLRKTEAVYLELIGD